MQSWLLDRLGSPFQLPHRLFTLRSTDADARRENVGGWRLMQSLDPLAIKPSVELRVLQGAAYAVRRWKGFAAWQDPSETMMATSISVASAPAFRRLKRLQSHSFEWEVTLCSKYPLYITKGLSKAPLINGCCFGMCMEFIAAFLTGGDLDAIAQCFSKGASFAAVMAQNLYHRHLAPDVRADTVLMDEFLAHYNEGDFNCCRKMLLKLMKSSTCDEVRYVTMLEMENLLDLEAPIAYFQLLWRAKNAVARHFNFSFATPAMANASTLDLSEWLLSLPRGIYLLSIAQHALVYISEIDENAVLFDPANAVFRIDSKHRSELTEILSAWSPSAKNGALLYPVREIERS
jgi:hypothetical protein